METRKQKLIELLNRQDWVCSTDFQANYVPEFHSIISRMNKYEGFTIISESCLGRCGKKHDSTALKRWRMEYAPNPIKQTKNESAVMKEFREEYQNRERKTNNDNPLGFVGALF